MGSQRWQEYEDVELVVECLVGNAAAFDGLVARYRPAVLATVLRLVPARPVAEDICQETFVRAFRALLHLRDPTRFAAWLHAIARREVIRHGPAEARAADHAPLDELDLQQGSGHPVGGAASGSSAVERWVEGEAIRQAMASLPEELQLVLTLRYWADLSLEQIAAYLGRPLSTVKWRLHRARLLMKQQLTPPGDRPSARPGKRRESEAPEGRSPRPLVNHQQCGKASKEHGEHGDTEDHGDPVGMKPQMNAGARGWGDFHCQRSSASICGSSA